MNCNYKVKITDIQTKYKFKVFCTGYDDSEIKDKINTMYEAWPKATAEGETPTLDNTANATMSIDLKGNTSQYTTTGINILKPIDTQTQSSNGITRTTNADGSITFTGTATANSYLRISDYLTLESNTSYTTLNQNAILPSGVTIYYNNLANIGVEYNDTVISPAGRLKAFTTGTVTGIISIAVLIQNGTTVNVTLYPMLVKGTITSSNIPDYEPYTNGASPNPDYPQDVHVVTGDNSINVVGKNLFDSSVERKSAYPAVQEANIGQPVIYNNSTATYSYVNCAYLEAGQTYKLSYQYTQTASLNVRIGVIVDKNNIVLQKIDTWYSQSPVTLTPTYSGYLILATDINTTNIQIELGSQATTYEAYTGASYPVNLGTMELCKIGDYQDSIVKDNGKWYLNKQIGKVVLNGSENYSIHSISGGNIFRYAIGNVYIANNPVFTNYFKGVSNSSQRVLNSAYLREDNNYSLDILTDIYSAVADFKTWLGTHNTNVYYVLAKPTYTEITDSTLISQLEALKEAYSYAGQTNISQTNDDKSFILTAKALKDLSNL